MRVPSIAAISTGSADGREALDFAGASGFAFNEPREEDFPGIASICARYGKGTAEDTVTVIASKGSLKRELVVQPASQKDIEPFFIG